MKRQLRSRPSRPMLSQPAVICCLEVAGDWMTVAADSLRICFEFPDLAHYIGSFAFCTLPVTLCASADDGWAWFVLRCLSRGTRDISRSCQNSGTSPRPAAVLVMMSACRSHRSSDHGLSCEASAERHGFLPDLTSADIRQPSPSEDTGFHNCDPQAAHRNPGMLCSLLRICTS
jgi:hypothetical protein